jgi:hypothetical protein
VQAEEEERYTEKCSQYVVKFFRLFKGVADAGDAEEYQNGISDIDNGKQDKCGTSRV